MIPTDKDVETVSKSAQEIVLLLLKMLKEDHNLEAILAGSLMSLLLIMYEIGQCTEMVDKKLLSASKIAYRKYLERK